jgi:hypothetical protein
MKSMSLSKSISGGLAVLVLAACASATDNGGKIAKPVDTSSSTASSPTDSPAPTPTLPPAPQPAGTYSHDCTYLLGKISNKTYDFVGSKFVADAHLHNTGNIGTVDLVKARWLFAGGGGVTRSKVVRVPAGKSKRVSLHAHATSQQISAYQATASGDECHVKVAMITTFGQAR